MQVTSELYRRMMQGREIVSRIEILLSSSDDTIILRDKDIVRDTFSVNWRSSNNQELTLGACYATSISFTAMKTIDIEDAIAGETNLTVVPTLYYQLGNGQEEAFPLGIFICTEPKQFIRTTSFDCVDEMVNFDLNIPSRFSGTAYNVLSFICGECGVVFGNTSQEISSMCNSAQVFTIDPKSVYTYRDALSYISIMLGCYCQIGRNGKLYVKRYHTQTDIVIERSRRTDTVFAGYMTTFAGIKCRFLSQQNYYPYEYVDSTKTGLILDVGDIPIVEDTDRVKHEIIQRIYTEVLANCAYYPCQIGMVGDPSIEAGDMIETVDKHGILRKCILTSVSFVWRGVSTIISEGSDPKQERVATQAKRSEQRNEQMAEQNTVVTTTFVNAGEITLTENTEEEITNLRFVTNKDLTAIFGAEIPVYSDGNGYVEITYSNNGIDGDTVIAQVHEGHNLITLVNHLHYDPNLIVLLQLHARTAGIGTGTAPTVTISPDKIRSYIFAQGIQTEAPWDGIIAISEDIALIRATMALYGLTESVSVKLYNPIDDAVNDTLQAVVSALETYDLEEEVSVGLEYGDQILRMGMGHRSGMGRMFAPISV